MTVGTIVKLTVPCLGNPAGTLGVGFNDYGDGCQFIFANGNYDGFSIDEQSQFLKEVGFSEELSDYEFESVIKTSNDFDYGVFDKPLQL